MKTTIEGKIALVTGSNRGIGRAIVEALFERGASKVYATARDTAALAPLVETYGNRVEALALDVTDPDQVNRIAEQTNDAQVVVNNAGVANGANLFEGDLGPSRQEFEVNYWGSLNVARSFVPVILSNGGGALVNISSVGGLVNFPMFPTYSDSKAAVHSLTQGIRQLKKAEGLQVVGVYPGPVDTDMAADFDFEKASPASVAGEILDAVEAGAEEVFPDPMAKGFAEPYEAGAKTLERATIAMMEGAAAEA